MRYGIVIIGRNEGERLRDALQALTRIEAPCVYVDSGSTDQSVQLAEQVIGDTVTLNNSRPYTAARGRNEGMRYLLNRHGELDAIQFVDGDCTLDRYWPVEACRYLLTHADCAVVCGRLREREAGISIYKTLCDIEWDAPVGNVRGCGGIFMARTSALREVGGFDDTLRAGEEPELCTRIREAGWVVSRIATPMAVHDAGAIGFRTWWARAIRSGYAAMQSVCSSKSRPELHDWRRVGSIVFWAVGLPIVALGMAWPTRGLSVLLLLAYPLQWWRVRRMYRRRGRSARESTLAASFTFIAKCAECTGLVQFALMNAARSQRPATKEQRTTCALSQTGEQHAQQ